MLLLHKTKFIKFYEQGDQVFQKIETMVIPGKELPPFIFVEEKRTFDFVIRISKSPDGCYCFKFSNGLSSRIDLIGINTRMKKIATDYAPDLVLDREEGKFPSYTVYLKPNENSSNII